MPVSGQGLFFVSALQMQGIFFIALVSQICLWRILSSENPVITLLSEFLFLTNIGICQNRKY